MIKINKYLYFGFSFLIIGAIAYALFYVDYNTTVIKQKSLKTLLLDYSNECYKDSSIANLFAITIQGTDTTYLINDNDALIGIKKGSQLIYEHKQPTFKGFIDYVKKNEKH